MIADLQMAPVSILFFLGTCMAVVAGFAVLTHAALSGKRRRARRTAWALGGGLAFYAALLLGASLFSQERVLGRGVEKYYCEVDCHLAYSVQAVRENGGMLTVELRTRFDETTTSLRRPKDATLTPNARRVYLVDGDGNHYQPSAGMTPGSMSLDHPLLPGESYQTVFIFPMPRARTGAKLMVENAEWPNRLLIGHENSPLHGKSYFAL